MAAERRLSGLRFIEEDLRATGGYGFRDPWRLSAAFRHRAGAFALSGVSHFIRNTNDSPRFPGPQPRLTHIPDVWVWHWKEAFPRGWVVQRARVGTDDEAFAALDEPLDALAREVVIDHGEALDGAACASPVTTTEVRPEEVHQVAEACAAGYLVLGDAWYPGWEVTVDGATADPVRAWGFLRAVRIGAGRHEVVWSYRPRSLMLGALWTVLTATFVLGVLLNAVLRRRKAARLVAQG